MSVEITIQANVFKNDSDLAVQKTTFSTTSYPYNGDNAVAEHFT